MKPKKSPSGKAGKAQSLRSPRVTAPKTKAVRPKISAAKKKTGKLVKDAPASAGLRRGKVESVPTRVSKASTTRRKLAAPETPPQTARTRPARAEKPAILIMEQVGTPGEGTRPTPSAKPPLVGRVPSPGGDPTAIRRIARKKQVPVEQPLTIPAILLEGDEPAALPMGGPGQKYVLGPVPPTGHSGSEEGELPAAYGTKKLMLIPRDPHWLYAHWDLTNEQQRRYNALSSDRHLVIRVYRDEIAGEPVTEIHVHPESRHWFIHVVRAETKYVAELGYYSPRSGWEAISVSAPASTPSDSESSDRSLEFATLPGGDEEKSQFTGVPEKFAAAERKFLAAARSNFQMATPGMPGTNEPWTPGQERALAEFIGMDEERREWINSMEISELIHRQIEREISSIAAAQMGLQERVGASETISSPPGGLQPQGKGFWFNLNAELIIYGATEPDANVTVAGKTIKLRPDGTFSFRFALPDGQYQLAISAISADNDQRQAQLNFGRRTEYKGEVGAHPQDKMLSTMPRP